MRNLTIYLVFLLAIGILLRLDFVFFIVYVLVGLWLLARFGFERGIRHLSWQRRFADHAFLGDRVAVEIVVYNRGRLPLPWLRITDATPVNLYGGDQARVLTSLGSRERFSFRYWLDCNRRGYYTLGPTQVTGGDPLGFMEVAYRQQNEMNLTVYPRILPLAELGLDSRQPFGVLSSRQRLFEDPARLSGMRDYRTGDSIRRIHWKASAHAGHLQVKKVDPAIALESVILLNLNQEDYHHRNWHTSSEWGIVLAASLANHLSRAGQPLGLRVNGSDPYQNDGQPRSLPPQSGHAHLMQVLEVLARVAVAPANPFTHWLNRATLDLNWGTTLLVITPQASDEVSAALHQQARRGFNTVLLVTEPYARFEIVRDRARHLGFAALNLASEDELKRWARGQRHSAWQGVSP